MIQFNSLPSTTLSISSYFGMRINPVTGLLTMHNGVDIRPYKNGATDDPIKSVMSGKISDNYYNNSRGWVVTIDHGTIDGNNVSTLYQHLKIQSALKKGDAVKAGEPMDIMGTTGSSTGIHLHFELMIGGKPVDPEPYLLNIIPEQEDDDMIKYKTLNDVPSWGQEAVKAAMNKTGIDGNKILSGDQNGDINLTETLLRTIVMDYRLGLFK